ncbi:hypothetical protein B7Z28_01300 [Candidatus Saccharibacteria bacterium 32-45-3]|nr:MAG: hypothetical protein B7Z28_01300 [Candidatus Saccharibacteria bacterium 32-45-3]
METMRRQGFTVVELIIVIVFLVAAGFVLMFQVQKINAEHINSQKKTAINAIYYSLEESFYPENEFYPEYIEQDTLKTMDSALLTAPDGTVLGQTGSTYHYESKDCQGGKCKSYTLRTTLSGEADFIKESRNS